MDIFRLTYMAFISTLTKVKIRFKNLTVTLHQIHMFCSLEKDIYNISCIIKNRYAKVRFICKIKLTINS